MVVVEAVDELLAMDVALVLRPTVPQGYVGIDDEETVAVLAIHVWSFSHVTRVTFAGPSLRSRTPRQQPDGVSM